MADSLNHVVRAVDLSTGEVTTVLGTPGIADDAGGDGPAAQVLLSLPLAVDGDAEGGIVVADTRNRRVVGVVGGRATTLLGGSRGGLPDLRAVDVVVAEDGGEALVVDQTARRVWATRWPAG